MVEATPAAALEVAKPNLLLEFLVFALIPPTQLVLLHQSLQCSALRQRREPVFGRLALTLGPLDQQPFFRPALVPPEVTPRNAHAHPRKPRGQVLGRAFAPCHRAPSGFGQAKRERLDRERPVLGIPPQ